MSVCAASRHQGSVSSPLPSDWNSIEQQPELWFADAKVLRHPPSSVVLHTECERERQKVGRGMQKMRGPKTLAAHAKMLAAASCRPTSIHGY